MNRACPHAAQGVGLSAAPEKIGIRYYPSRKYKRKAEGLPVLIIASIKKEAIKYLKV
jgi:hypothetical protein